MQHGKTILIRNKNFCSPQIETEIGSITTPYSEIQIIASHIVCLLTYLFIFFAEKREEEWKNIVFPFLIKCFLLKQKR